MINIPKFKFLNDEPIEGSQEGYFNFYHTFLAPALREILKSSSTPRTIGIYGAWGTGKSSIIKMLKADKELDYPIFIFDAWKYQKDSLRRTFLIQFDRFLREELHRELPEDILNDFYVEKGTSIINHEKEDDNRSKVEKITEYLNKNLAFTISLSTLVIFITLNLIFGGTQAMKDLQGLWPVLGSLPFIAIIAAEAVKTFTSRIVTELATISTGKTKQVIRTESTKILNSPEQFELKFVKLLQYISEEKAVIVFDNIDRVSGEIAVSMLSTIKSFMEPVSKSEIISIIPCDPDAINERVKSIYPDIKTNNTSLYAADEYLRKVFNIILWLPNYMVNDLEEYTKAKLKETGEISKVTNKYDVVVVINAAYRKNPRDIIQFINNLTALVITAYQTDIKQIMIDNIGYLAKIQVIRQKFPDEYKKLQIHWNNPEGIESDNSEYNAFMQATNRITVPDAEPYIFFKNPLNSRGVKNSDDVLSAMINQDTTQFEKFAKDQNKESLTDFTQDMFKKYRQLDDELANIYNTQFHGLYAHIPDEQLPEFHNLVASMLDTDLWRSYKKLDIDNTFKLLSSDHVTTKFKRAIIQRFLQATELKTESGVNLDLDISIGVINQIFAYPKLFNKSDRHSITLLSQRHNAVNIYLVEAYKSNKDKYKVIMPENLLNYMNDSALDNLHEVIANLRSFSSISKDEKYMLNLAEGLRLKFDQVSAAQSTFGPNTLALATALGNFISTYQNALKGIDAEAAFEVMAAYFRGTLSTCPDETSKGAIIRTLWWLYFRITPSAQSGVKQDIEGFISSSDSEGLKAFFNDWSSKYKVSLMDETFPAEIRAVSLNNIEISNLFLGYYENDENSSPDELLSYLITNSTFNPQYANSIIPSSRKIKDLAKILDAIISKLRSANSSDTGYIELFNRIVRRNADPALKSKLYELISYNLQQNDNTHIANGSAYFDQMAGLNKQLKNNILSDVVDNLKTSPYPLSTHALQQAKFLMDHQSLLDSSQTIAILNILVGNFRQQIDQPSAELTLQIITQANNFDYRNQASLVNNMFTSISEWPDMTLRAYSLNKLRLFKSSRAIAGEKAFWKSVDDQLELVQ